MIDLSAAEYRSYYVRLDGIGIKGSQFWNFNPLLRPLVLGSLHKTYFTSVAHVHVFLNNIESNQEKEVEETCSNHTEDVQNTITRGGKDRRFIIQIKSFILLLV
ncbi:hypothetical protein K1719_046062 [Acacia pycnantha]|nr:hypothetical protein K1719_046062 [Acacia pycnantha]